jgi:hypothetical protein
MTNQTQNDGRVRACDISERDAIASGAMHVRGDEGYALETAWEIRAYSYPIDPLNPTHLIQRSPGKHLTHAEAMITKDDINAVVGTWRTMDALVAAAAKRDLVVVPKLASK